MSAAAGTFAAVGLALYAAHHVGDYWVQTHEQAQHKGDAGSAGRKHCLAHVLTYLVTQWVCVWLVRLLADVDVSSGAVAVALLVSGATHYMADRREHGLMFWLARRMPWKAGFLTLGAPRAERDDNPTLGTGAHALDQSWHILFGVFVPALLAVAL